MYAIDQTIICIGWPKMVMHTLDSVTKERILCGNMLITHALTLMCLYVGKNVRGECIWMCVWYFLFFLFFLVMLKCYGYQHNYILMYAVWWLIMVRCTWDGLDPSAPMTRRMNEVPPKKTHKNINMPLKLQVMLQLVLIKRPLFTRVLIRCTSILHKVLNTTWFNNNNNWLYYGTQAWHEVDESKYSVISCIFMFFFVS